MKLSVMGWSLFMAFKLSSSSQLGRGGDGRKAMGDESVWPGKKMLTKIGGGGANSGDGWQINGLYH